MNCPASNRGLGYSTGATRLPQLFHLIEQLGDHLPGAAK